MIKLLDNNTVLVQLGAVKPDESVWRLVLTPRSSGAFLTRAQTVALLSERFRDHWITFDPQTWREGMHDNRPVWFIEFLVHRRVH